MTIQLITSVVIGLVSGYLGSFMVLRRMALVGDALSHVALPGIALALLWNINPFIGAFAALFVGIIVIWFIEHRTNLNTEALVGLTFTASLAVGLLITPHEDILDALIGDISSISVADAAVGILLSMVIFLAMRSIARDLVLYSLSPDLAKTAGVKNARTNFIFLLLVAGIVALGIKVVGTLLMGALVIIPAISARNISTSMTSYTWLSIFFGGFISFAGLLIANAIGWSAGPVIVLAGCAIFGISFLLKKHA